MEEWEKEEERVSLKYLKDVLFMSFVQDHGFILSEKVCIILRVYCIYSSFLRIIIFL